MTDVIRVDDCATKAELEAAIAGLRSKQNRMPAAWADRRAEVADEIDLLVDRWLELS